MCIACYSSLYTYMRKLSSPCTHCRDPLWILSTSLPWGTILRCTIPYDVPYTGPYTDPSTTPCSLLCRDPYLLDPIFLNFVFNKIHNPCNPAYRTHCRYNLSLFPASNHHNWWRLHRIPRHACSRPFIFHCEWCSTSFFKKLRILLVFLVLEKLVCYTPYCMDTFQILSSLHPISS